ncbi:MAG: hypothetical protein ABSG90_12840 [Dehalococcoidia bacterium]|jgi:hypothetical protein
MGEKEVATQVVNFAVVKFDANDALIGKLSQEFMPLKIDGLDDEKGLKEVHKARMVMVKLRTGIEEQRKGFVAGVLKYQKDVNTEAKRLVELAAPIEEHLTAEENKITQEKLRIKEEADRKEKEHIQARINRLQFDYGMKYDGSFYRLPFENAGISLSGALVSTLPDADFEQICTQIYAEIHNEKKRVAAIEAKKKEEEAEKERLRKIEEERLAKERAEQEAERKRLAGEKAKIDAENKRIAEEKAKLEAEKKALQDAKEAEEREKKRLADLEQMRKDTAEKARIEAEEKAKKDAEEKERLEREAKEKAAREEALKPDKTKLLEFATMLETLIMPATQTAEGNAIVVTIADDIGKLVKKIRKAVKEL